MTTLRRRLVPYFLMFPGTFWLVVFFVVPMYYMARLSLDSGTLETGFHFNWQWSNYNDALSLYGFYTEQEISLERLLDHLRSILTLRCPERHRARAHQPLQCPLEAGPRDEQIHAKARE